MEHFIPLVESLGVPVSMLIILILAVWRMAKWFAPKVEKVFEAHIDLVQDLREQTAQQTHMTRKTLESVTETNRILLSSNHLNRDSA